MTPLRLKQYYRGFNPGEIAGFPPDHAKHLVAEGIAEEITPKRSSKKKKNVDRNRDQQTRKSDND